MTSQHTQEATVVSLTETVVDPVGNHERPSPMIPPALTTTSSHITTTSPGMPGYDIRQPLRKETTYETQHDTIPPEPGRRNLILCFDGTGDQFDADNSNIVQLVSLLKKGDRSKQMVYYQSGIGTYTTPQVASPFTSKISKTLDEMFAWNLDAHVMSGYEFLMQNYQEGDKICIFGFSRGAYTARSLAGMLHKVGLLPTDNHQQVPFAYKMYTQADDAGWEQSNAFKVAFSADVDIEFLGVWDTVDSVGLFPKRLPFTTSNTIVKTFRHALALDERRAKFKANLWNRPTATEEQLGILKQPISSSLPFDPSASYEPSSPVPLLHKGDGGKSEGGKKGRKDSIAWSAASGPRQRESEEDRRLSQFEKMYAQKEDHSTDVEEVWFAGCHTDVGGGSVSNKTKNSLARISLRWMVRECFKAESGIMFDSRRLRSIGLDPMTLYPYITPRSPAQPVLSMAYEKTPKQSLMERITASFRKNSCCSPTVIPNAVTSVDEDMEDLKDALSPIYDQLKLRRGWWILEVLPLNLRYQNRRNEWVNCFSSNMARPRYIPKQKTDGIKVHRTVKLRMEADAPSGCKKYKPRANISVTPTWID